MDAFNLWPERDLCLPDRDMLMHGLREQIGEVELIAKKPDVMEVYLAPGWVAVVERKGRDWCVHARRIDNEER